VIRISIIGKNDFFVEDNESKRRRAETRATEEAYQIKQKEDEIDELTKILEKSRVQLSDLDEEARKNQR
jgi:hypothetical protein